MWQKHNICFFLWNMHQSAGIILNKLQKRTLQALLSLITWTCLSRVLSFFFFEAQTQRGTRSSTENRRLAGQSLCCSRGQISLWAWWWLRNMGQCSRRMCQQYHHPQLPWSTGDMFVQLYDSGLFQDKNIPWCVCFCYASTPHMVFALQYIEISIFLHDISLIYLLLRKQTHKKYICWNHKCKLLDQPI